MIKAHSLLYAIYISLFVALFGYAILEYSNVYNKLSLHFQFYENNIIEHQSCLNFFLNNSKSWNQRNHFSNNSNIKLEIIKHGVFKNLIISTFSPKDTLSTSMIICEKFINNTALYVPNLNSKLSYFGKVKINGSCFVPNKKIEQIYISNQIINNLVVKGKLENSKTYLPKLNSTIIDSYLKIIKKIESSNKLNSKNLFNSFRDSTKVIEWKPNQNYNLKGKIILFNKEEIIINETDNLIDIIAIAPKIIINENFTGNLQVYALEKIEIKKGVNLKYPSFVFLNNDTNKNAYININENSIIGGNVIIYSENQNNYSNNKLTINHNSLIIGDIYCTGLLNLKAKVIGSVYTNMFIENNFDAERNNTFTDLEINCIDKPKNYFNFSIIENDSKPTYGVVKKSY